MYKRTWMFSASRNCVQLLATGGRAVPCCTLRWWSWMNGTAVGLRICSRCLCAFTILADKNAPVLSIRYTCPHITPPPPRAAPSTTLTSANRSPTRGRARCHLPHTVKTRIHPWWEHLSKVPGAIECEHWPTQVSYANKLWSGLDPDEDGEHADELLRRFPTVQTVAVWSQNISEVNMLDVEALAGMVTPGWGWLDVLLTSAGFEMAYW